MQKKPVLKFLETKKQGNDCFTVKNIHGGYGFCKGEQ